MSGVGFAGWTVFCADLETTSRFYADALGFTRESADDHHIQLLAPVAGADTTVGLLLHLSEHPEPMSLGSFEVDDIDALISAVRTSAGEVRMEPNDTPWGVREAAICDPDGNGLYVTGSLKPAG